MLLLDTYTIHQTIVRYGQNENRDCLKVFKEEVKQDMSSEAPVAVCHIFKETRFYKILNHKKIEFHVLFLVKG